MALISVAAGPSFLRRSFVRAFSGFTAPKNQAPSAALVRSRAEWFFRQRASAGGHVPGALLLDAMRANESAISQHKTFFDQLAAKSPQIAAIPNKWTPLGPQPTANTIFFGNVSGRVTAIASDPCDASGNTVYAGGADGGVWVSFNALAGASTTWTPLSDSQPSLAIGAIALVSNPCGTFHGHAQSSEILAGTGESNFAGDNLYGAGVLRSINGGATWAQDQTFTQAASQGPGASGPYIAKIAVQPNQAHPVLLAAVQGTDYAAGGALHSGIWRSTDGGVMWTRSQPGASTAGSAPFNVASDVVFDPYDPTSETAFAALGDPKGDTDPAAECTSAPCNGVYTTSDAGVTWTRLKQPDDESTPSSFGRIRLALAPSGAQFQAGDTIWIAIADATTGSQDLLSVLAGPSLSPLHGIYPSQSDGLPDFCAPLCFYSMEMAAVPTSAGYSMFAGGAAQPELSANAYGTSSTYRSTDGGMSWSDMSADGSGNGTSVHTHVHAFSIANNSAGQPVALFVGNDGGVWSSTDVFNPSVASGSQHWADLNTDTGTPNTSLNLTQFYPGMSVHPSTDQILYGGTRGNDAQEFSGSLAWSGTEACPWDGGYTAIDPDTPTTIYVACNYLSGPGTVTKNTQDGIPGDDGVNWNAIDFNNGINFSDNASFIPPFVLDANATSNLYFGTYRLYQTTNAGTTWSAITGDLTRDSSTDALTAINVAPSDSNVLYVGTSDGLLWFTSNALSGASNITQVNKNGQPSREVSAIAIDPLNSKSVFAAYSGFSCPGVAGCDGLGHVFYSANSGSSWVEADGNLPDVPVNDVVIDPTDATDNTVYLATDAGVFASANATAGAGTTWSVLQAGLPNAQVLSLKLRNVSRTLVAGTHGRGAWNIQLPNLPAFVLTGIDPVSADAGSNAFQVTATGAGFTKQSAINEGGAALATNFVSATTLAASIPASDILCGGVLSVNVTDPTAGSTNALPLGVVGSCDFSIGTPTPPSVTTAPGGMASYQFTVQQQGNSAAPVQLACTNPPSGFTCAFSPNPVMPSTAGTTVNLTVSVPSTAASRVVPIGTPADGTHPGLNALYVTMLFVSLLLYFSIRAPGTARLRVSFAVIAGVCLLAMLGVLSACGGGGGGVMPPPSKTYQLTVTGSAGNLMHSASVQVVVD